jgi:hypothetical protein
MPSRTLGRNPSDVKSLWLDRFELSSSLRSKGVKEYVASIRPGGIPDVDRIFYGLYETSIKLVYSGLISRLSDRLTS